MVEPDRTVADLTDFIKGILEQFINRVHGGIFQQFVSDLHHRLSPLCLLFKLSLTPVQQNQPGCAADTGHQKQQPLKDCLIFPAFQDCIRVAADENHQRLVHLQLFGLQGQQRCHTVFTGSIGGASIDIFLLAALSVAGKQRTGYRQIFADLSFKVGHGHEAETVTVVDGVTHIWSVAG